MLTRRVVTAAALGAYVFTVVVANWASARYGFVPVGFGLTAIAGTYAAGAALLTRDVLQDTAGRRLVLVGICLGAALSAWLSTPRLAAASAAAFLLGELIDMVVYTPLRRRGWARAVLTSNVFGSAIDTCAFLALIGRLTPMMVSGQLVGKILWATALPVALVTAVRRLRRRPLAV